MIVREKTDVYPFTFEGKEYKLSKTFEGTYAQHWAGEGVLLALGKSGSNIDKVKLTVEDRFYDVAYPLTSKWVSFLSEESRLRVVSQRNPLDTSSRPLIEVVNNVKDFVEKNPEVKEWLTRPAPDNQSILK